MATIVVHYQRLFISEYYQQVKIPEVFSKNYLEINWMVCVKLKRAVGKIERLESFKLERSFQVLPNRCPI